MCWRSSPRSLLSIYLFPSGPARETLTNTLPMIYSTISEERRARSSIDRSFFHSPCLSSFIFLSCLSCLFISLAKSFLVAFDRAEHAGRWKRRLNDRVSPRRFDNAQCDLYTRVRSRPEKNRRPFSERYRVNYPRELSKVEKRGTMSITSIFLNSTLVPSHRYKIGRTHSAIFFLYWEFILRKSYFRV